MKSASTVAPCSSPLVRALLTAVVASLASLVLMTSSAACSSNPGPPSCSAAMEHLYGMSCDVTSNGTPVSEQDAINGCSSMQSNIQAGNCPCGNQFNSVLTCSDGISTVGDCSSCSAQWTDLTACINAHSCQF